MKTAHRVLGAYQVLAGACSLVSLAPAMAARGWPSVAALVGMSALSIVAGALMWRVNPAGWPVTVANQLTQLIGIYSPLVSFLVIHCVSVTIYSSYVAKATLADSLFTQGVGTSSLHSVCDVSIGKHLEGSPTYGASMNLVALGILVYVKRIRGKADQSPDPASAPVTPPARRDARRP